MLDVHFNVSFTARAIRASYALTGLERRVQE